MSIEEDIESPFSNELFSRFPDVLCDHEVVNFLTDNYRIFTLTGLPFHELESIMSSPIVITGHTDSTRSNDKIELNNWDLSSVRANAARRILEEDGLSDKRTAQVIGLSDTVPYDLFNSDSS